MSQLAANPPKASRSSLYTTIVIGLLVLIPSMLGFADKLIEFFHVFSSQPDGAFAITPIANYLLASAGFFCMLLWSISRGMIREIENPKFTLLEQEDQLDLNSKQSTPPSY